MAERKAVTKTIATRYKPDREVPQPTSRHHPSPLDPTVLRTG